jgi:hypothetical protein
MAIQKLWRSHHLTDDRARYVANEVRQMLAPARPQAGKTAVAHLSREEERRLIVHAYRLRGERRVLIKMLLQTGVRGSEFVAINANLETTQIYAESTMEMMKESDQRVLTGRAGASSRRGSTSHAVRADARRGERPIGWDESPCPTFMS